jgi:two-component system sensor histidine kinase ResE
VGLIAILLFLDTLVLTEDPILKILKGIIFIFFLFFGYYLIRATHEEEMRREEAERLAAQERVLREEAEMVAVRESALRKKLERLNQARQQFLLSSQHYFRTPLTAIRGFLELALDNKMTKSLPDEVEKWLRGAKKGTEELKKRIEESLEISQMESGKKILELKEVQLEEPVKETIKEVKIEAEFKKLPLIFEKPKTPLIKVKVDEARMREALSNIIENAIKHTPSGKIVIKLEEVKGGRAILFSVKDTGIGIPKEELSFIGTTPFERGKGGQKLSPLGKGIGLYLSRLIIESHGGKLRAESEGVDKGSTFFVELPIK